MNSTSEKYRHVSLSAVSDDGNGDMFDEGDALIDRSEPISTDAKKIQKLSSSISIFIIFILLIVIIIESIILVVKMSEPPLFHLSPSKNL